MIYSFKTVIMKQLTTEQRVFVVQHWFITRSIEQVRLLFRQRFPDREPPTRGGDLEKCEKILRTRDKS